ncbi:MAG: UDP-N-acetylmuramoyl-L-alanine--D-glutamate ligase, partial [Planctomycetota bacterium]
GGHRKADLTGADLVIANPAVPPGAEPLAWAKEAGVAVDTEINLFFRTFAGDIVGVTGSNGKSTTTALTASVLRADGRRVFCGGNLG